MSEQDFFPLNEGAIVDGTEALKLDPELGLVMHCCYHCRTGVMVYDIVALLSSPWDNSQHSGL